MTYVYIGSSIVVLGILLIFISIFVSRKNKVKTDFEQEVFQEMEKLQEESPYLMNESNVSDKKDGFLIDDIPEINELIQNYYEAYAAGNIESLKTYATPVSEMETSYITMMSSHIQSFDDIRCYVKNGLKENEYAVSVVTNLRFEGITNAAPGMDFFYVRIHEDGTYYIDNLSCAFNMSMHIMDIDNEMTTFIAAYNAQDDFKELQAKVQLAYDEIMGKDEELKNKLQIEIAQAIREWSNENTSEQM